jgi:transposase
MRHAVIVEAERRRRWSEEQKLAIVLEVGVGGTTVADVARRHDVTRQHIYQWRRELRRKGFLDPGMETSFVPVALRETEALPSAASSAPGEVEIVLANGRCLRGVQGLSAEDLGRLIRLVEQA